jgi:WD repeat-containing protein 81
LNEIGWSVPQPFSSKIKPVNGDNSRKLKTKDDGSLCEPETPWTWVPRNKDAWEFTDYVNRTGLVFSGRKDDQPWKLKMTTCHSWRAHPGPLKAIAVGDGEATIFTAGVGTKMRGLVKQWKMSTTQDIMEYTGHEEVCVAESCNIIFSNFSGVHLYGLSELKYNENEGTVSGLHILSATLHNPRSNSYY